MSLNFRMLLLCYHYIIVYAFLQGLCSYKVEILYGLMIIGIFHATSKKEDDYRNRMRGSVWSIFQKVQIIHELEFSYAYFILSLCYCLCGFYTDYASTKKSPKKLCYVNNMILCLLIH